MGTKRKLDLNKVKFSDKTMTTKEALKDVVPFKLSKDVIDGKKEIIVSAEVR